MEKRLRSDLFCENFGAGSPVRGEAEERRLVCGFETAEGADGDGARYCSVFVTDTDPRLLSGFSDAVARCAGEFVRRACGGIPRRVLVAGLGNGDVPSDSFGAALCRATETGERDGILVCAVATGVPAQTGICTADHVGALARGIGATLVVAADSLAAISPERLFRVLQITDAGVSPGSGVSSHADRVSPDVTGCPVISLGVPTAARGRLSSSAPRRGGRAAEGLFTAVGAGAEIAFYAEAAGRALNRIFRREE